MESKINRLLDVVSKKEALDFLLSTVRDEDEADVELDVMIDASFEIEWKVQFDDGDDIHPLQIQGFVNNILKQSPWIRGIYAQSRLYKASNNIE